MTDAPKRPRGRPPTGSSRTAAERMADSRARRGRNTVELPDAVAAALDTLAQRHGDPSRAAAVARAVRMALG